MDIGQVAPRSFQLFALLVATSRCQRTSTLQLRFLRGKIRKIPPCQFFASKMRRFRVPRQVPGAVLARGPCLAQAVDAGGGQDRTRPSDLAPALFSRVEGTPPAPPRPPFKAAGALRAWGSSVLFKLRPSAQNCNRPNQQQPEWKHRSVFRSPWPTKATFCDAHHI